MGGDGVASMQQYSTRGGRSQNILNIYQRALTLTNMVKESLMNVNHVC